LVAPEPEIALCVSTFEKPWHLQRVLTSIAFQEGVEGRMELVVTDDGSTDETPRIVEQFARRVRFPVAFTTHPHRTFQLARCRNEGAAASKAPYLLFLDGDCVLPPGHVLEHLKRRRANYAMGAYYCRLDEAATARCNDEVIRSGAYLGWASRRELFALAKRDLKARFYRWIGHPTKPKLIGCNIGVWRRDYERVNGYDENYEGWGCEDDDLRLRLRRAGVRTASILRWTRPYHLWHPPNVTSPGKWREGPNVSYFSRKARLTRCMNGLVKRNVEDLVIRVVGSPASPQAAAALLKSRRVLCEHHNAPALTERTTLESRRVLCEHHNAEVELLFLPGLGRFSGQADCNVLVVLGDSPRAKRMARNAHVLVADRPYRGVPAEYCFPLAQFDDALKALGQKSGP